MTTNQVERVVFQPDTYEDLQRGINQVVRAVRPTLGPHPRLVAIENTFRGKPPELLDDGGTIARRIIELSDRNADMGAMLIRHVLWRVHEQVGDGTATTAVLFQSIFNQGVRYIVSGGNPMQLRRYLGEGAKIIIKQLSRMAIPLEDEQQLAQMAESICYDRPLAKLLGEVFNIIGQYGHLEVRAGKGRELEREYTEGMYWDSRIFSRAMLTNNTKLKTELLNTFILVTDLELEDPQSVILLLEMVQQEGISRLLILAKKMSDSVIGLLVAASRDPAKFQAVAAKTPEVASTDQFAAMGDLAALVGGRPLLKEAGHTLASVKLEDLGQARRAWVGKHRFGVVGGKGDALALRSHIASLRAAFANVSEADERMKLQERLGKLMGGSATLWIGGATEVEIERRQALALQTAKALRGAVKEGVLPGGGVSLLACRPALQKMLNQGRDVDERAAYDILIRAMDVPIVTILRNAGHDAGQIMVNIRSAGEGYGYDVRSGEIVDMVGAGIWDAVSVLKAAAYRAVVTAALALTTDVLIHHKKPRMAIQP